MTMTGSAGCICLIFISNVTPDCHFIRMSVITRFIVWWESHGKGLFRSRRRKPPCSVLSQELFKGGDDVLIIVDDQDPWLMRHRANLSFITHDMSRAVPGGRGENGVKIGRISGRAERGGTGDR